MAGGNCNDFKDKSAGNICITAAEHSANTGLWSRLVQLTADQPDINVEICID